MNKRIIISLFVAFIISLNFMLYNHFSNRNNKSIMNNEQSSNTLNMEENNNEMEESENETVSNIVESDKSVSTNTYNGNVVSDKNNKKNDNTSSSNRVKKNNSKVESNKEQAIKKEEIPDNSKKEETSTQPVSKSEEKEEKGDTSKSVEVVIETAEETNLEKDPTYIRMKKELFSSSSECNNKGMELNLKDMENIASTMCSSESYKGVEVGFRLYIRYKDGTYKEYKK